VPKQIPLLTTAQMQEVDRLMIEKYHIELIQMMENAGRALALTAKLEFFDNRIENKKIAVLAGTGGNGGGALVAARRLHNWGVEIEVFLTKPAEKMRPVTAHQLNGLMALKVPVSQGDTPKKKRNFDLIIDGIIGYSLKGNPKGTAKEMIEWTNAQTAPVLALDTPSGIDLTSGKIYEPAIHAVATLSLALPKKGLFSNEVKALRGKLFLADIGVPPELYKEPTLNIEVEALFAENDILLIEG